MFDASAILSHAGIGFFGVQVYQQSWNPFCIITMHLSIHVRTCIYNAFALLLHLRCTIVQYGEHYPRHMCYDKNYGISESEKKTRKKHNLYFCLQVFSRMARMKHGEENMKYDATNFRG